MKPFVEHEKVLNNRTNSTKDGVIHLDLMSNDNVIITFKVRNKEPLQKVIDSYCMRQGFRNITLKRDNVSLNPNKTLV